MPGTIVLMGKHKRSYRSALAKKARLPCKSDLSVLRTTKRYENRVRACSGIGPTRKEWFWYCDAVPRKISELCWRSECMETGHLLTTRDEPFPADFVSDMKHPTCHEA